MSELNEDNNDFFEKETSILVKSLIPKFKQPLSVKCKTQKSIMDKQELSEFDEQCNQEENNQLDQKMLQLNSRKSPLLIKKLHNRTLKTITETDNRELHTQNMNRINYHAYKISQRLGKGYDIYKVIGFSQVNIIEDDKIVYYKQNKFSHNISKVSPSKNQNIKNLDQSRDQSRNSSKGKISIHEIQKNTSQNHQLQETMSEKENKTHSRSSNLINSKYQALFNANYDEIRKKYIQWNPQELIIVKRHEKNQNQGQRDRDNKSQDSIHQSNSQFIMNQIVLRKENYSIDQLPLSYQSLVSKGSIHSILKNQSSSQQRLNSNQSLYKKKVIFGLTQEQIDNIHLVSKC